MITINAHSLVGSATKNCWTQAQSLSNSEQTISLVLNLKIKGEEGVVDLASIGGAIFEKFHEYGDSYHTPVEWQAFVKKELGELADVVEAAFVMSCIYKDTVWLWGMGETAVSLYRAGEFITIVESGKWSDGVSGKLLNADTLILGTAQGLGVCTDGDLSQTLSTGVLNYIETLAPLIHQRVQQAEIGAVVLGCTEEGTFHKDKIDAESHVSKTLNKERFPEIVVKRMREEPRKFNLVIGSAIGIFLLVLIVVGAYVRVKRQTKTEYTEVLTRSDNMIREAEAVAESNPERAKILIAQSIEVLEKYIQAKPKSSYIVAAKASLDSVKNKQQKILRVSGIELMSTIELSVLSNSLQSERIVDDSLGSMYFWDDSSRSITSVSVKDLSKTTYNVENERFIRPFSVRDGVYTGMAAGGVWSGDKAEQKIVIQTDPEWGEISQVATFGNNIYLLDRGQGEIWKYAATDNGYADRKRWFGAGIVLDLSKVVDWVVDGDIWLLTSSGKLEKYSRGAPVGFTLTGFPSESATGGFVDPIAVAVVGDNIYVLERGARRVVVFDATGKYQKQYVSEDFSKASDLMVYDNKGYVLVNNVIKEWEL
jgi:hypothetical protein